MCETPPECEVGIPEDESVEDVDPTPQPSDPRFGVATGKGTRDDNEDHRVVISEDDVICFGVFDGHGGKDTAKLVSKLVQWTIPELIKGGIDPVRAFKIAFGIFTRACKEEPSGSTAVVVLICGDKVFTANLGDSFAMIIGESGVIFETVRHVLDAERVEQVKKDGGRVVVVDGKPRLQGVLAIADVVGDRGIDGTRSVPTITEYKGPFSAIIAGSDGLDVVTRDEICKIVQCTPNSTDCAEQIVNLAIDRRSENSTAVVYKH